MKKTLLCILLVISSCQKGDSQSSGGERRFVFGDHSTDDPLPNEAFMFEANVQFINFTITQEEKMKGAIETIKRIIATEDFREKILNHTYNGVNTFVDNNGYTNAQIYQIILEGSEKIYPTINNAIDVEVELYYQNNNVVGYTYPKSPRIWVNTKYFNTYSLANVARNLFHEWLHKLGFNHDVAWSPSRDYSVPYAIGDMVEEIAKKL